MDAFKLFLNLFILALSWKYSYVDACFPGKYWISCLINSCKFGGKCPGDPDATCKMERTECNGCKMVWYSKSGEKANCNVGIDPKLCPNGERVVQCLVDSCKWPCKHPDFKNAKCRQSNCGECKAEYFLKDAWVKCPKFNDVERLPIDTVVRETCVPTKCDISVCLGRTCPAVPRAVCRTNNCNVCAPAWFLDDMPVDCETGAFLDMPGPIVKSSGKAPVAPWQRECSQNEPLTPCGQEACEGKICRNFPNAICRPDGCGGCRDTWFLDNKLVDCLSDECPPRVPIIKCVDDPCKYFGHYCPTAECRASQCGKCEAKFFAGGHEIDCAMPPKECPAGIKPRSCPWYTCPANICPSNNRLMCQIDPCDAFCNYNFIDIYTGETGPCRVFDGDGSHKQDREDRQRAMENQKILEQQQLQKSSQLAPNLADIMKPMLAGNIPEKKSVHHEQKLTHVDHVGKPVYEELKKDVVKSGPINAAPVLKNAGPPIQDPDLLSLLQAFPHEMRVIPSEAIQGALKTHPNDIDIAALQAQAVSEFSGVKKAAFETPIEQSVHKIAAKEPMHKELVKLTAHVDSTGGKIVKAQETPLDVLYPELKGMVPHEAPLNVLPNQEHLQNKKLPMTEEPLKTHSASKHIESLEQEHINQKIIHNNVAPVKPNSVIKPIGSVASKPVNKGVPIQPIEPVQPVRTSSVVSSERKGVPISFSLFNGWASGF
ncbi:uncharacterized protein LOC128222272 [Mya arenaria]|uniref:uncharacterized protein LOC128222272 n=1 Tax=Mya arenaria TaxID=6604 RepID=UPI0022E245FE|nr:uncharacterized protein LOC128222272 [Mya arenaria]